jgi:hypothetical protein
LHKFYGSTRWDCFQRKRPVPAEKAEELKSDRNRVYSDFCDALTDYLWLRKRPLSHGVQQ